MLKRGATGQSHTKGGLLEHLRQWANQEHAEAMDLQKEAERVSALRIGAAPDRELVTVAGTLRTVTLRPRGGVPALEAELSDGTGTLTLLWLGRRRIAGIGPGRSIEVTGRIGVHGGVRLMYNPRYNLRY
jgi:hypothetical protein